MSGVLGVSPFQLKLTSQFSNLSLEKFPEILFLTPSTPVKGIAQGNISYNYPDKKFSGSLQIKDGVLGSLDAQMLQWDNMKIGDFKYKQSPPSIKISTVNIDKPVFSYSLTENKSVPDSFTQAMQQIFSKKEGDIYVDVGFEIAEIKFTGGIFQFKDLREKFPIKIDFHNLRGSLKDYNIPEKETLFSMQTNYEKGNAQLEGALDLSSFPPTADYTVSLNSFPLTPWEKHIRSLFTIKAQQGHFHLVYNNSKQGESKAQFTFKSLESSEPSSDLDHALALLQDSNQQFPVNFEPIKTSPLISQIITHFQKLLVKYNVSPYLLLEPPFNKLVDKTNIDFLSGDKILLDSAKKTLLQYGKLLQERPNLILTLQSKVNRKTDRETLFKTRTAKESERVKKENDKLFKEWKDRQQAEITTPTPSNDSIVEKDIPKAQLESFVPLLPNPIEITEADLIQLGENRLNQIITFLSSKQKISKDRFQSSEVVFDNNSAPMVELTLNPKSSDK